MNRFSKTARVIANPFHVLDHKGRPCCAVPKEPGKVGEHAGYIGAKLDRDLTKITREEERGEIRGTRQETVFSFSSDPVEVPTSLYYRDALRSGSLIAADKATAQWAGVDYVEPEKALADAEKDAEAAFDQNYGKGSIATLRGTDNEPATDPAEPPPGPSPENHAGAGRKSASPPSNFGDKAQ